MKDYLPLLSAAALLALSGQAHAAEGVVADYLRQVNAAATARVAAAGVDVGPGLKFKAHVGGDGRLTGVRVVETSGSLEADRKATQALSRFRGPVPPAALGGAEIRVRLQPDAVQQAVNPQTKTP